MTMFDKNDMSTVVSTFKKNYLQIFHLKLIITYRKEFNLSSFQIHDFAIRMKKIII